MIIIQKHQEVYGNIIEISPSNQIVNSISFKHKIKITGKSVAVNTKDVKIAVPLKYLKVTSSTKVFFAMK